MSQAYVIEINDVTVGLVVLQDMKRTQKQGYRFYASSLPFRAIEGKIFSSPAKAHRAARAVYGRQSALTKFPISAFA